VQREVGKALLAIRWPDLEYKPLPGNSFAPSRKLLPGAHITGHTHV
jgi:hypothetical protein